jgi:hypothetical protein
MSKTLLKRRTIVGSRLVALASALAFAAGLNAANNYFGIEVDNSCYPGTSCPAIPLPYNTSNTLPVAFNFNMPNGDRYLINGSGWGSNNRRRRLYTGRNGVSSDLRRQ